MFRFDSSPPVQHTYITELGQHGFRLFGDSCDQFTNIRQGCFASFVNRSKPKHSKINKARSVQMIFVMSFWSDTQNYGLRMRCGCQERFPRHRHPSMHHGTCRASRTCRDAYRDRLPAVARKTLSTFPVLAQPAILLIWLEAYVWKPSIKTNLFC